jgi:hypothetical protein
VTSEEYGSLGYPSKDISTRRKIPPETLGEIFLDCGGRQLIGFHQMHLLFNGVFQGFAHGGDMWYGPIHAFTMKTLKSHIIGGHAHWLNECIGDGEANALLPPLTLTWFWVARPSVCYLI